MRVKGLGLLAVYVSCVLAQFCTGLPAAAQSASTQMEIVIPETFEIYTGENTPLPLRLKSQSALAVEANIMIKGLPERVSLSEGKRFQSGIWGVNAAFKELSIICPEGVIGSSLLTITVVTIDGTVLDGVNAKLIIKSQQSPPKAWQQTVQAKKPNLVSVPSQDTQLDLDETPQTSAIPPQPKFFARAELEQIHAFMKRGAEHLQLKNITVARLFFRRAAEQGWAPAALAMGATYDPAELLHFHIVGGIRPDVEIARKWYERALELGSEQARDKLAQLAGY